MSPPARTPPRRPGSMSDADRALAGREHRFGVPQPIDPEATPLPIEPPAPESIDGFEELDPAVQRQFQALHDVQREHDVAFHRLWDTRHIGAELEPIRAAVTQLVGYTKVLEGLPSMLQVQGARLESLIAWKDHSKGITEKLTSTLEALDGRLDKVETDYRLIEKSIKDLIASVEAKSNAADKRVDELEKEHAGKLEKIETRVKSLEDDRIRVRAGAAVLVFIAGFLGWLIERLAR